MGKLAADSGRGAAGTERGRASKSKDQPFVVGELIDARLRASDLGGLAGPYAGDGTIQFFWRLAQGRTRTLLGDLAQRRYYKRVLEIPLSDFTEEGWVALREQMTGDRRLVLQRSIATSLILLLRSAIQDQSRERTSLVTDKTLERAEQLIADRFAFLIDLPIRGWTARGDEPLFVSDYKRRHFRAGAGTKGGFESPVLWSQHMGPMMRNIAFFRVYCEPDLHKILRRVLGASNILADVVRHLPPLRIKAPA